MTRIILISDKTFYVMGLKQKFSDLDIVWISPQQLDRIEDAQLILVTEDFFSSWKSFQAIEPLLLKGSQLICLLKQLEQSYLVLQLISLGCCSLIKEDEVETQLPFALQAIARGGCYLDRDLLPKKKLSLASTLLAQLEELENLENCLSNREREVLELYLSGFNQDEIGGKLGIAKSTVSGHFKSIRDKLNLTSNLDILTRYNLTRVKKITSQLTS